MNYASLRLLAFKVFIRLIHERPELIAEFVRAQTEAKKPEFEQKLDNTWHFIERKKR